MSTHVLLSNTLIFILPDTSSRMVHQLVELWLSVTVVGVTGAGVLATYPGIALPCPNVPGVLVVMIPGHVPSGMKLHADLLHPSLGPHLLRTCLTGSVRAVRRPGLTFDMVVLDARPLLVVPHHNILLRRRRHHHILLSLLTLLFLRTWLSVNLFSLSWRDVQPLKTASLPLMPGLMDWLLLTLPLLPNSPPWLNLNRQSCPQSPLSPREWTLLPLAWKSSAICSQPLVHHLQATRELCPPLPPPSPLPGPYHPNTRFAADAQLNIIWNICGVNSFGKLAQLKSCVFCHHPNAVVLNPWVATQSWVAKGLQKIIIFPLQMYYNYIL
ncbi:uncharacterized protein LOC123501578 [Portunus trituberculatus]|uniref:uncharacterized protein LOC123501578 n=1 Tax=Portunus trituberculatus TaxID=210409 RepID=UPI001E1CE184|nr:uncharacterized protein LOC123501578 [Portunus trituberculatus]